MEGYVSSAVAAEIIGCTDGRVCQLCRAGKLTAEKIGRDWLVQKASAEEYAKSERKPGPKPAAKPAPKRKK
jgi:excisionase family DNA binding protein